MTGDATGPVGGGADSTLRRRRILLHALPLAVAVRLRLPPRLAVPLVRRALPHLGMDQGAAMAAALRPLVPDGIDEVLDEPYGDEAPRSRLDAFLPASARPGRTPALVWVHGGGWIGGTKDDLREYLKILAGHGFATFGVDYSWAPERHYPTQVHQVRQALEHLAGRADRFRIDPDRLVLAGDSAGAHIAAQLALALRDPDYAAAAGIDTGTLDGRQVVAVVLACGPFTLRPPDLRTGAGRFEDLVLRAYTGHRRYLDVPAVRCVLLTDTVTAQFPPAFITAGTSDPMLRSSRRLAVAAAKLGVPVDALFFPEDHEPDLPHEYQLRLDLPEARLALDRIVRHVATYAGPAPTGRSS